MAEKRSRKQQVDESPENPSAFKHLFDRALLVRIAKSLRSVAAEFDSKRLLRLASRLGPLEMKARVSLISAELRALLPQPYPQALALLMKSVDAGLLNGFDLWPYSAFIQTFGLEHPQLSLQALAKMTPLFTSEFAVRPYLIRDPVGTLAFLQQQTLSSDAHLRRWASEGSRPRLPWGERLHAFVQDPEPTLPILEQLKFDSELYVRKSVSNHLNDIAKDHPRLVIATLKRWRAEALRVAGADVKEDEGRPENGAENGAENGPASMTAKIAGATDLNSAVRWVDWITARALRTLIKQGEPSALALIGVKNLKGVTVGALQVKSSRLRLGERLEFEFQISSSERAVQKIVVDYIIHFVRANQSLSPKVFKLKTFSLSHGAAFTIGKSHHLKAVTTRTHHPGQHFLEIQINGEIRGRAGFWIAKERVERGR